MLEQDVTGEDKSEIFNNKANPSNVGAGCNWRG